MKRGDVTWGGPSAVHQVAMGAREAGAESLRMGMGTEEGLVVGAGSNGAFTPFALQAVET